MAASSKTAPGAAKGMPQGATHRVENQPPPLADYNAFETDRALVEALAREGGDFGRKEGAKRAKALGARVGSAEVQDWARLANRHTPELHTHDRFGHRIDRVEYHPAWHHLMALAVGNAVHALPWRERRPGAHAVKAALAFLMNQGENGVCCPMAMTFAAVPALTGRARAGRGMDAPHPLDRLRRALHPGARQGGRRLRHGDDREAGRLGRARQFDPRPARGRRGRGDIPADRA